MLLSSFGIISELNKAFVAIRLVYLTIFAEGEVNIGEYSQRRRQGEYSPMLTEHEANNCLTIIFRGEYEELQNNGLKRKTQTQLFVRIHVWSRSFYDKLTCTCTSIANQIAHRVRQ